MVKQSAWLEQGRQLYRTHANSQFAIGDWVVEGIASFGRTEAFNAAQTITGTTNTRNFYTRCAAMASYYKPELRFQKLGFHTYEVLARFPIEFLTRFIPEVAESGRSCAQLYALAVERYGSDPRRPKRLGKTHKVKLPEKLFCALSARSTSPDKTHLLIVQILEDWLGEPQSAGKASVPVSPSVGNDFQSAQPRPETGAEDDKRPTYSERREQQLADGGEPIPKKLHRFDTKTRKCICKIRAQFVECHGKAFIESNEGNVTRFGKQAQPSRFKSEVDAVNANRIFAACHGYEEEVSYCAACRAFHLKHKYSGRNIADVLQQYARA